MKLVAVTSRPTGIAHGQMTAEDLLQAGERFGRGIDVEVQGVVGTRDEPVSGAIAKVDAVTITSDMSVSRDCFDGKLILRGMIEDGMNNAEAVVQKATELAGAGKIGSVTFGGSSDGGDADVGTDNSSDDADATKSDKPVHRGGGPEKRLFARPEKLFS